MAKTKAPIKDGLDSFLLKVGKKLKTLRVEKGYTNYIDFAYENNIAHAQYGRYEVGKENMKLGTLHRLLKIHNITFEEFFKDIS